jgi:hypothetical protein
LDPAPLSRRYRTLWTAFSRFIGAVPPGWVALGIGVEGRRRLRGFPDADFVISNSAISKECPPWPGCLDSFFTGVSGREGISHVEGAKET